MRLNKFLAERLGLSRREADDLIAAGKVTVDNKPAVLGARVEGDEEIWCDGKLVPGEFFYTYLILNKPRGYVCSRKRQGDAETIYSLIPEKYYKLKPVGRLDKDSSGVLILTDDGDLAFRMTHPSFKKQKVYEVVLDKSLAPLHQQMIGDFGVSLEDGVSKLGLIRLDEERKRFEVTMSEGRNRQIRRTFGALGYTVMELDRQQFGKFKASDLRRGEWREIQP